MDNDSESQTGSDVQDGTGSSFVRKIRTFFSVLVIEPMLLFAGLSSNMVFVAQDQMLVYKICREFEDSEFCHNFEEQQNSTTPCPNSNGSTENCYTEVEHEVVDFHNVITLSEQLLPIMLSFYLGSWSDQKGRIPIIGLCLLGKIIALIFGLLSAIFLDEWNRWIWLATVMIPQNLTGGFLAWIMVTYSFNADNSSPEYRTLKLGAVTICYQFSKPIATALGGYLFSQGSFVCVYSTALALILLAAASGAYNLWGFKEKKIQQTKKSSCLDLIHYRHVLDSFKTTFKKRDGYKRFVLLSLISAMLLTMMPVLGEHQFQFMYTKRLFKWGVEEYSWYSTTMSAVGAAGLIFFLPLFHYVEMQDNSILIISIAYGMGTCAVKALASTEKQFYVSAVGEVFFHLHSPPIRGQMTKCVNDMETGKIFAMLASVESLVPVVSATIFTHLYNKATAEDSTLPLGICYYVEIGFLGVAIVLVLLVMSSLRCRSLDENAKDDAIRSKLDVLSINSGYYE